MTDPKNPYFSRAIVNRVWANFMGPGLVEAVDDMRLTNPGEQFGSADGACRRSGRQRIRLQVADASHSDVGRLPAFQRHGFPATKGMIGFIRAFYARRLKAEVLLDAVSQVTESATQFKGQPSGTRALQLADAGTDSYFLNVFGRPDRLITCECERSNEPSMSQVLHITNGDTLNAKIEARQNRISRLLKGKADDQTIVKDLYLAALTRLPTPEEENRLSLALADVETGEQQLPLVRSAERNCGGALRSKTRRVARRRLRDSTRRCAKFPKRRRRTAEGN